MSDRLFVGTRKGLFDLRRRKGGWDIAAVHFLGDPVTAKSETAELKKLAAKAENSYWAEQIEVLALAASAWTSRAERQDEEALKLMRGAADLEDSTEKHVAMENRLYPMREMLGDLLLELGRHGAGMG